MITRVVKMTFRADDTKAFEKIFENTKHLISGFEGCREIQFLNDISDPSIYFTISKWNSGEDLENYRRSDLFKETWAKVKPMFAEKAQAWSLKSL